MDRYASLPKKGETVYRKIKDLKDKGSFNIKCEVCYVYDWVQSKGGDYVMTLKVKDDSFQSFIFIKIFSKEKCFPDGFSKGDLVRVHGIKKYKDNFYLCDKNNDIELIERNPNNAKSPKIFLEKKKIKDLQYTEYISFTGLLINKQVESANLVVLAFIDNTKNPNIAPSFNKGIYTNSQVLYVKAWDQMAKVATSLVENVVYTVENIKINLSIDKITGNLSDSPYSKIVQDDEAEISKVLDNKIINVLKFNKALYKGKPLVGINEISEEGYYKILVTLLRHHPNNGMIMTVCKLCRKIEEASIFKCNCENKKESMFIVKYLVKDQSGKNIVVFKNDIAKKLLSEVYKHVNSIEMLIYCTKLKTKLYYEVKDIPLYV